MLVISNLIGNFGIISRAVNIFDARATSSGLSIVHHGYAQPFFELFVFNRVACNRFALPNKFKAPPGFA